MAVGGRNIHDVHWLMGQSPAEMNDWMTAISNTLPPPPQIPYEDKVTLTHHKGLANGYAKPISNGCATIIPNGRCSSAPPITNKATSCASKHCQQYSSSYQLEKSYRRQDKRRGKFDNDHTVLAGISSGVCVDWGHGWGWAAQTPAVAPQISFAAETALSSALYCHSADDYSVAGFEDIDWSAFGDFCF